MTALSSQGYLKLNAIMGLEKTLFDMERASGGSGATRDAERYAFAVFGKPGADADWGWRIEGHHVSLNFTVGERLCVTPSFLGANPAEVRSGPTAGLRVLAREEDLARALVQSMSDTQRPKAIIAPVAPPDILLQPGMDARAVQSDVGLPVAEMTPDQRDRTFELIAEYVASFKTGLGSWLDDIRASDPQALRFAWAGAIEPGKPHYYRISNAHFAIEYDNTQNDANHIHTVWRDFDHDFGDPLREHLREDHGARVAPR